MYERLSNHSGNEMKFHVRLSAPKVVKKNKKLSPLKHFLVSQRSEINLFSALGIAEKIFLS